MSIPTTASCTAGQMRLGAERAVMMMNERPYEDGYADDES